MDLSSSSLPTLDQELESLSLEDLAELDCLLCNVPTPTQRMRAALLSKLAATKAINATVWYRSSPQVVVQQSGQVAFQQVGFPAAIF